MKGENLVFYGWWLLADEAVCYMALDFLCDVTGTPKGGRHMLWWLLVNGLMIGAAVFWELPGMFLADILLLIFFAKGVLHIKWDRFAAPAAILFTCYTFLEGFSGIVMSWIACNVTLRARGVALQMLVSCLLDGLFFGGLWFIRRKYGFTLQKPVSSYLYILLLPGTFIILAIRYGLRLDSPYFEAHLSGFGITMRSYVCFMMLGAVCLFFLMIEIFCRIIAITEHEQSLMLLGSQAEGQRIYIEEAKRRQEQYSSFCHDIRNHLLVLSGLIGEKHYEKAREYALSLHAGCQSLSAAVSTGNEVLDVLLEEKLAYARHNQIEAACSVKLPDTWFVEDMDLCVIFANLMDNAVLACQKSGARNPFLSISAKCRSRFLVVEALNSSPAQESITMGTGLRNVKSIAEKYQGTVEIQAGEVFRISVLLCMEERDGA